MRVAIVGDGGDSASGWARIHSCDGDPRGYRRPRPAPGVA